MRVKRCVGKKGVESQRNPPRVTWNKSVNQIKGLIKVSVQQSRQQGQS